MAIAPVLELYAGGGSMYNYIIAGGALFFLACIHKVAYRKDLLDLFSDGKVTSGQFVCDYLNERFVNINKKSSSGNTLLHHFARSGTVEDVRLLLERGADPNVKGHNNLTPLEIAYFRQKDSPDNDTNRIFKLLFEHAKDKDPLLASNTPLFDQIIDDKNGEILAIFVGEEGKGLIESLKFIHDVDKRYKGGVTFLHIVYNNAYPPLLARQCTRYLIKHGADVDAMDYGNRTPIYYVHDLPCVRLLLNAKANVRISDCNRNTPLEYQTKMNGNAEVIKLLKSQLL
jgi:ankyrin repeat protein